MLSELIEYLSGQDLGELARDLTDLMITYYVFYRVFLALRGTRALQVGVGLALVFLLYVVAQLLQLHTVLTLLNAVLSSAILIGVVVFQNDIRRGLMRMGSRAKFGGGQNLEAEVIDSVVEAATQLARHRIGAIVTFEQEANLDEFVGSHTGSVVDAAVSTDLLISLFIPEGMNKLHDGAVIIRDLRIAKAGVFFPMPEGRVMDLSFGSRHRAAMGITEETDAVVVVVSEERGTISFCFNGNIVSNLDGDRLRAALESVFAPKRRRKKSLQFKVLQKLRSLFASRPAGPAQKLEERRSITLDKVIHRGSSEAVVKDPGAQPALSQVSSLESEAPPESGPDVSRDSLLAIPEEAQLARKTLDRSETPEAAPAPLRKLTQKKKGIDADGNPKPLRKRSKDERASEEQRKPEGTDEDANRKGEVTQTPLRHLGPQAKDPAAGERSPETPTPARAGSIPPPRPMPQTADLKEARAQAQDDAAPASRRPEALAEPGASRGGAE